MRRDSERSVNNTIETHSVWDTIAVVPPLLVVVREPFRFHEPFQQESILHGLSTRVRCVCRRRESVEWSSHVEWSTSARVHQSQVDREPKIMATAARDVTV